MILKSILIPCVIATGGVTVGVQHHAKIKRAIHKIVPHKPRKIVAQPITPTCILTATPTGTSNLIPLPDLTSSTSATQNQSQTQGVIGGVTTPIGFGQPFNPITTYPPLTSAIPEPDTWAMMMVGFGMVGYAARKRKVRYVRL